MPPLGFEPTIPAIEQPQTHALDRAATGTGATYIPPGNYDVPHYGVSCNLQRLPSS